MAELTAALSDNNVVTSVREEIKKQFRSMTTSSGNDIPIPTIVTDQAADIPKDDNGIAADHIAQVLASSTEYISTVITGIDAIANGNDNALPSIGCDVTTTVEAAHEPRSVSSFGCCC